MAITRIIGDIHGMVNDCRAYLLHDFQGSAIQVGDFGIGMGQSDYWHESVDALCKEYDLTFIRGNHDNPAKCKEMYGWIKDGTVKNNTMFIGGAWSIDNPDAPTGWYKRTSGVDWWPEEELSDEEFTRILEIYATIKPEIVISHDCPASISNTMFKKSGIIKGPWYYNRTSDWLDKFMQVHQPQIYIFGHWHHTALHIHDNTYFMCLGELDYIDLDLNNIEQSKNRMIEKVSPSTSFPTFF